MTDKTNEKYLLIIQDQVPRDFELKRYTHWISELKLNWEQIVIFLRSEGVKLICTRSWNRLEQPGVVFYANAADVARYGLSFYSNVIYSGLKTLQQLQLNAASRMHYTPGLLLRGNNLRE